MPSNVLFRLFLLLTTQVGSISAVIRLIFENCYNYTLLNAKINVLWAIVICNSCTLLRNVKKVFCKNAQPASAQCRSRVWVVPNKHFAKQNEQLYIQLPCWYNVIDETKIVSSKTVIWLCRFPKHSNIEVLTGAESGKTACLVSIQELLTA